MATDDVREGRPDRSDRADRPDRPDGPDQPHQQPDRPDRLGAYAAALAALRRLGTLAPSDPQRPALREFVIGEYMSYARYVAGRFRRRGEAPEDLEQVAYVGLVKAVDSYDAAFDTTFLTYATPVIAGEIKRHFRDTTWDVHVPRRMQELSGALRQARESLAQTLGRDPTVTELAEHLDAGTEEIVDAMEASAVYNTGSLDVSLGLSDGEGATLGELIGDDDPGYGLVVDRESLKPLLAELDERDKRILLLRYFRNMSQTEIGEEIGVSQMQVSRLLTRILGRLREGLGLQETAGATNPKKAD
ncbi:RNA polymerase sigma-B factor [Catenulispora sp. GP43]|uniref:SigB/SigF/SigG family RNA polymerase sigma factor n=1 Tax=Catenulispora sp. GP43 TaxID=3156263 RepID=UPI0035128E48